MKGQLFTISSIVPGNGAKYFATNLAYYIKKRDKKDVLKVLLVDFDFENPYLAYEYINHDKIHGVDNLLNTINAEALTDELFVDNIITTPLNVDVIKGTTLPEKKKMFTKSVVEMILKKSLEHYDYVFVVTGSNMSDAGMVYSLFNADQVFLVARNNYTNLEKAPKVFEMVSSYYRKKNPIMIVHNYKNTNATSEFNSLLKDGVIQVVGAFEYDEKSIDNINLSKDKKMFNKSPNENEFYKIIREKITMEATVSKNSDIHKNRNKKKKEPIAKSTSVEKNENPEVKLAKETVDVKKKTFINHDEEESI